MDASKTVRLAARRGLSRRRLARAVVGLGLAQAGVSLIAGCRDQRAPSAPIAAEAPPETSRLRLAQTGSICQAPQYVAGELLRAEGFTEVQYIRKGGTSDIGAALGSGEIDINLHFAGPLVIRLAEGEPIVVLAGGHVGCFELFGTDQVRTIRDLKGRSVAITEYGSSHHIFVSTMAAHVGLDPRTDINWTVLPAAEAKQRLAAGSIDAYLGFPPDPQELKANRVGHVVVNSAVDKPWSQYFCCMVAGNREFVRKNPVATKRAVRAILKAADICASEPERAAQVLVERGFTERYDYSLTTMRDLPYGRWRDYDPEDTLRFYALRLKEAGMVKSTPKQIISRGTDWRILNELKKELKG